MNVDDKMDLRWVMKEKEGRKEKVKEEKRVKEMILKRFYKWLKVFEKTKSERMPTRKPWDHAIDLKTDFVPKKEKIYSLSRIEREEQYKIIDM